MRSMAWHPPAAYLYALHLDGPSLAWEYLRRNPAYRIAWDHRRRDDEGSQLWGLRLFEDPADDARSVQPAWLSDAVIAVLADNDPLENALPFRLWDIPGHKMLIDDGRRIRLASLVGCQVVRMAIARGLEDGAPYAYAIRAGGDAAARWHAIEAQLHVIDTPPVFSLARPKQSALGHMRALQALDGTLAGASHREVAEAVFGSNAVAERWHPDGDMRAQVRRLIRRGETFMKGGYRRLLNIGTRAQGR